MSNKLVAVDYLQILADCYPTSKLEELLPNPSFPEHPGDDVLAYALAVEAHAKLDSTQTFDANIKALQGMVESMLIDLQAVQLRLVLKARQEMARQFLEWMRLQVGRRALINWRLTTSWTAVMASAELVEHVEEADFDNCLWAVVTGKAEYPPLEEVVKLEGYDFDACAKRIEAMFPARPTSESVASVLALVVDPAQITPIAPAV